MRAPVNNFKCAKYPDGDVTQWFGENVELYKTLNIGLTKGHNGIDIVRPWGEHLFACADAVVCELKDNPDGYGKHLRLLEDIGGGKFREWTYGHMSEIVVKLGQKVIEGQHIGNMGNTGFVVSGNTPYWTVNPYAGTHLHFGLRNLQADDEGGWAYMGAPTTKVSILNYDNGSLGNIDPVPTLGGGPFTRSLGITMSGEDVARLQVQLVIRGFLETTTFGYFGIKTWFAVRRFQAAYLLPVTGYFGRLTSEKLNSLMKSP